MQKLLHNISHHLSILFLNFKMTVQSQMEYPSFLVGWLLANPLQFGFGILGIFIIVSNFGSIGDWGFQEITFLYGISVVSHGLTVVLFIQTWNIEYTVRYGEFDRYMLRPLGVFFQMITSYINLIGLTDMIPGLVILIYGCVGVGFEPTPLNILKLLITILGAVLIRGAIYLISGSVAFFTKSSGALIEVDSKLFDAVSMYPTSIYPKGVQILFTYLFPIAFISFYSAREFLGKTDGLPMFGAAYLVTLGVGVLLFFLAYLFFKWGLSKYESSGS